MLKLLILIGRKKLFELSDNPYTQENADEIFASVICEFVPHPGVAGLLVDFFTGQDVNRSDKDRLVSQIIQIISDGGDVEMWLLLTCLEGKDVLRHQCPCDEHLLIRRWFTRAK